MHTPAWVRLFLFALALTGCLFPTKDAAEVPLDPHGSDLDPGEDGPKAPLVVDLPSWVQSADDYVEGTIVEVRAAWSPMFTRRPPVGSADAPGLRPIHASECAEGHPAVDLVLTDVRSLQDEDAATSQTVRMGGATFAFGALGGRPAAEVGDLALTWPDPAAALSPGTQIGTTVHRHSSFDGALMASSTWQPFLRIDDSAAALITLITPEDMISGQHHPELELDVLLGVVAETRWHHLHAARVDPNAPTAAAYRAWLQVDATMLYPGMYAADCTRLVGEASASEPCDTGLSAADCNRR